MADWLYGGPLLELGGGDSITVGGVAVIDIDFDNSTPAAPADSLNVRWQKDASSPANISANLPYDSAALTVSGGNLTLQPSLTANARVAVSKNSGATVGTRRRVNLIEGANITLTIADDAGNEEVDVTITGAAGGAGDSVTVNTVATTDVDLDNATPAAPAGGVNVKWQSVGASPTDVSAHLAANDVSNTVLADMAANTIKANPTAGAADPADMAVGANTVVGRVAGNIVAAQLATAQIADDQVTYAKMQNVSATSRFLGRITAGAGDTEELTGTQATTLLDNFTDALKGLAPASGGGTSNFLRADGTWVAPAGGGDSITVNGVAVVDADFDNATPAAPAGAVNVIWQKDAGSPANVSAHVAANAVTNTVLADMAANTVKANATAGAADPADLSVGANTVVGRAAGNIVAAQLATGQIADDAVTYAKIQNVSATSRLLGRITAGAGDTEELTGTQATTLLDAFTSALKGLAPASGGGTTNFLRADGTWQNPPGSGGGPALVHLTTSPTFNSSTPANVTGLSFSVTNGTYYHYKFICLYSSPTGTVGMRWTVTIPAATQFGGVVRVVGHGADGTDCSFEGAMTSSGDSVSSTATTVVDTKFIAIIEGLLLPSADGTLQLQAANETGTTVVTVYQGSCGMLTTL